MVKQGSFDDAVARPAPRSRQQIQALLKLRELILSGAFPPGERVSELDVVGRLGISRTPIRAALTMLQHEGFLRTLPGGGFIVRDFSIADIHDAIDIRGVLEGAAARRAAERKPSPAELAPMQAVLEETDEVLHAAHPSQQALEHYVRLNERFHRLLLDLAASPMLRRSLAHVQSLPFASPNAFVEIQARVNARDEVLLIAQAQHRSIVEAIALGEGARAESLAREHARLARRNLDLAQGRLELMRFVPGAALLREAREEP
ncbi:MAG: GntR family transcriptional regulator [Hydrogenophilaceae bacterium]|jgi:GntR family transcriptional regulator of vanillate catabolism|nr:GntR family transcriptional regulator [Hydrogenophilaceae bacterium]